jgi:hypothetical protein
MQNEVRYINTWSRLAVCCGIGFLGGLAVLPAKFINSSASRNHILIFSLSSQRSHLPQHRANHQEST